MDGRVSTFRAVYEDLVPRLRNAEFLALTAASTGGSTASDSNVGVQADDAKPPSAATRLRELCTAAEGAALLQLGVTVVSRGPEGKFQCASYNLFAFPRVRAEDAFFCQAAVLRSGARQRLNFNTWIAEGISYMSREEEAQYLRTTRRNGDAAHMDEKVGLLYLWKALCEAQLPVVIHRPLDLFLVLAAFEQRVLPKEDPLAMAMLVRRLTPVVHDVSRLGIVSGMENLSLMRFLEEAEERYEELAGRPESDVARAEFELVGPSAGAYLEPRWQAAPEAGFDSLLVAQIFANLRASAPATAEECSDQLLLARGRLLDLSARPNGTTNGGARAGGAGAGAAAPAAVGRQSREALVSSFGDWMASVASLLSGAGGASVSPLGYATAMVAWLKAHPSDAALGRKDSWTPDAADAVGAVAGAAAGVLFLMAIRGSNQK
eukprot:TRINITY_DN22213_c0_g1_i1.p1 TRINITY_DN22213_c0_g1~~TRINITY_DN22213_c0_g1_i1.p1  ORF type:complete len:434 (-),score=95.98 TRINITY_DN22213_c0_g1_i1:273-1574(-)